MNIKTWREREFDAIGFVAVSPASNVIHMQAEIDEPRASLLTEVERVSKDAERYDYLLTKRLGWLSRLAPIPWKKQTTKEAMSSALDAAMKESS